MNYYFDISKLHKKIIFQNLRYKKFNWEKPLAFQIIITSRAFNSC